jgi:ATP-dependent helicase/nuclease subunit A
VIEKEDKDDPGPWFEPIDTPHPEDPNVDPGAPDIAAWIRDRVEGGEQIPTAKGPRPIHYGDVLILVQRRSELFHEIIRACKAWSLPIAGADRLKLGASLPSRT